MTEQAQAPRLTASRLELAEACPGSYALAPHVSPAAGAAAVTGTAIHAYIEDLLDGVAEPPPPDDAEARARVARLDVASILEAVGPVTDTEQPFGFDPETGEAASTRGPSGAHRDYSGLPQRFELVGTADAVSLRGDSVEVTDFKTGSYEVAPPHDNLQLLFLALAAARFYGRPRAAAQVVQIDDAGGVRVRRAELDAPELAAVKERLARLLERVGRSRGGNPELRPGRHCRFCPALHRCPAVAGEAQALLENPLDELDEAGAAEAWRRVQAVEAAAKRAREALQTYVAARGDLSLGGGRALKLVQGSRQSLAPALALALIRERFGYEAAAKAASVSPSSVKKALPAADAREVIAEVEARGGSTTTTYESLREGSA